MRKPNVQKNNRENNDCPRCNKHTHLPTHVCTAWMVEAVDSTTHPKKEIWSEKADGAARRYGDRFGGDYCAGTGERLLLRVTEVSRPDHVRVYELEKQRWRAWGKMTTFHVAREVRDA